MTNQSSRVSTIQCGETPFCQREPEPVGITIRIAETVEQIEEMRGNWSAWKGTRDSDIDFYLEFIRSHHEVLRPHVVMLYKNGCPDAMLIGRLETVRISSKIGYYRTPGMSARVVNFVYGGLRGNDSSTNSGELLTSVIQSLRRGHADAAFLHQPSTDSFLYRAALALPNSLCRDRLSKPEKHHNVKLPDAADRLFQGLSKGLRGELRRKKKKLHDDFAGRVTVKCYREPSEVALAIPHLEAIMKQTYQRGLGVGFEDTPQMRGRLALCATKGWLRIYVLYIDDVPRSFSAGTVYDGVYTTDYIAHDPTFRDYYLGKLLLMEVMESCHKEGVRGIDFGFGEAEYKERFGNCPLSESSVYIFAPNMRGLMLNAVRTISGSVDNALKATLERTQLLPRVKKLWRKRAAQNAQFSNGLSEN
jgi:Acetyltransferase (GNAT) domain